MHPRIKQFVYSFCNGEDDDKILSSSARPWFTRNTLKKRRKRRLNKCQITSTFLKCPTNHNHTNVCHNHEFNGATCALHFLFGKKFLD